MHIPGPEIGSRWDIEFTFEPTDHIRDVLVVRPVFSAVRSSRAAPAWDTTPVPVADADTRG